MNSETRERFISDFVKKNRDAVSEEVNSQSIKAIASASELLSTSLLNGGLVLTCGNGGSMADAMHLAEELSGKYRKPRTALRAIAISDPSYLTCVANDFGYEEVFSRSCDALLQPGDVLVSFSTSGESPNVLRAAERARLNGAGVVSLIGRPETTLEKLSTISIFPSDRQPTEIAQMLHTIWLHAIIELIEISLAT